MNAIPLYDAVIIGGGPAGLAAAVYCGRSKLNTLVIDKNPRAGALNLAGRIENYPGVPDPVTGAELLGRIRLQAERLGARVIKDEVIAIDVSSRPIGITTLHGGDYRGATVILATGAMGRKPMLKGEAEFLGKGVAYCAECDAPLFDGKDVVVVGRADLVEDELPQICHFARHVYLIPMPALSGDNGASLPNVEVLKGTAIREIKGDGFVTAVRVVDRSGVERDLPASGVFLYLQGRVPIVDFLAGSVALDSEGSIKVNKEDMSTSVEGVFAAGDVATKRLRQSVIAAAEGALAAVSAVRYVNSKKSTEGPATEA